MRPSGLDLWGIRAVVANQWASYTGQEEFQEGASVNGCMRGAVVCTMVTMLVLASQPAHTTESVSNTLPSQLRTPSRWAQPSALSGLLAGQAHGPSTSAWPRALSLAGKTSLVDQGVSAWKQALIDCQKGEYPGGGTGVLSLPQGRPTVITDHCWH